MLVGPVWKMVNPIRSLHWALSRALRTDPAEGMSPLPPALGYWPAAVSLLAFVWMELIAPDNTTLPVLRVFFAAYVAVHLLAATWWGSGWFDKGDGFEVFSSLAGRLSVLGRRADGTIVAAQPARRRGRHPGRAGAVRRRGRAARVHRVRLVRQHARGG